MPRVLCISATFLTGRYHGSEWPPSPARLVQAMVAGLNLGANRVLRPRAEPVLRWIERCPAPLIYTCPADQLQPFRLAVPNNDMDVVARDWAAGRSGDPAKLRTMKDVQPRAVEGPGPHVLYWWPVADGDPGPALDDLQCLARCLYSLGWGVDMAYADAGPGTESALPGYEQWSPARIGEPLQVPVPGFLDDLQATYRRFAGRAQTLDADTRPSVYRVQPYRSTENLAPPRAAFALREIESDGWFSVPWHRALDAAAWLRHASGAALKASKFPNVDGFVHGHGDGEEHMSFIPLPSVAHVHADGRIRRVMAVEPLHASGEAVERLLDALPGQVLTRPNGKQECTLGPLQRSDSVLEYYTRSSRIWRSVTPVILHGHNSQRGQVSVSKTENLLLRAFEMAGYAADRIESLAFQQAPFWSGTGAAAAIVAPKHLDSRPRYHVQVRFHRKVEGPVLAGIGRHCGIGVFAAPLREA